MARLNETTVPQESIELRESTTAYKLGYLFQNTYIVATVKRRFLRQNREIARTNSLQSVLIRDLESEVSSLLSENLFLREQITSLNQQVERLDAAKGFQDGVCDVKAKLDAKLGELSSLVADLGALPCKYQENDDAKPKPTHEPKPRASASNMRPRARRSTESQLDADDGRMPTLWENKPYPRQTLE